MARVYALLLPDMTLLVARPRSGGWEISDSLQGIEARGRNLTIFTNGLDVLGLSAIIPARTEKEAQRAAPFAVEDDVAETVEASHVALASPDRGNPAAPRQINVMSRASLTALLDALAERGLGDAELIAAHSMLPQTDTLFEAPGLVLGRVGGRSFSIDPSLGRDVVVGMTKDYPEIEIFGTQVAQALAREPAGEGASTREGLLVQLVTWSEAGIPGIRLRQGVFEIRLSLDLDGVGRWKLAGAIAVTAFLGWFAAVSLETRAMNSRSQALTTLSQEFAQVGWPELNGDVRQVLARARNADSGLGEPFLDLLDASAALYDALEQVDGSEVRNIRYDRARRQMTATVGFQSFADVDRLTAILNRGGLSARSGDARQSGSQVIGDLTLERAS